MTAISKSWVTHTDAATDADSPIDQALVQGLRDDLIYLREWLGLSYYAGAVADHNHDGVNSALVPVGPNALRNASFESGTDGWTLTQFAGGTVAQNADDADGNFSLGITSTVLANGGGTAESIEYTSCTGGMPISVRWTYKASVANVSARLEVEWYDNTKALISSTQLLNIANAPTTYTTLEEVATAPATARYYRVKVTGGVPAVGTAVGTVYFDGLYAGALRGMVFSAPVTLSGASYDIANIPAWARHVMVIVRQGSISGGLLARLGTAGGIVTSGYTVDGSTAQAYMISLSIAGGGTGDYVIHFYRHDLSNNIWVSETCLGDTNTAGNRNQVGTIALSAALTTIRLTNGGAAISGSMSLGVE